MAYSERAKALRRCKGSRKDGQPCQAYALWGGQLCSAHTYKRRGSMERGTLRHAEHFRYTGLAAKAPPCTCIAYQWPHRPGSGLCRWPDPPRYRSTIPQGHSYLRTIKRRYRVLFRRYQTGV